MKEKLKYWVETGFVDFDLQNEFEIKIDDFVDELLLDSDKLNLYEKLAVDYNNLIQGRLSNIHRYLGYFNPNIQYGPRDFYKGFGIKIQIKGLERPITNVEEFNEMVDYAILKVKISIEGDAIFDDYTFKIANLNSARYSNYIVVFLFNINYVYQFIS